MHEEEDNDDRLLLLLLVLLLVLVLLLLLLVHRLWLVNHREKSSYAASGCISGTI